METAMYVFKQNKYVGSGACLLNLVYPPGEALATVEVVGGGVAKGEIVMR